MKSDSLCKKVSVSLPAKLHEWLIQEAQKESENRGSRLTVSALIQEIINDWKKGKAATPEPAGVKMATLSESLGSGPLTATKKPSRRAG
jgi:hypothetical protein